MSSTPIRFFTNATDLGLTLNELVSHASSLIVLADENTADACYPVLAESCSALSNAEIITVPAGESSKSLDICQGIWESLLEIRADRNTMMINLGGGVVCDLGGFVASTYKRGIPFINLPTSLMAMADASIGGKTGIDLGHHKNMVGLFRNPQEVLICSIFLETLPEDELSSGFAEVIKHSLLDSNGRWSEVSQLQRIDLKAATGHIRSAALFKKSITDQDPLESGLRKILNYGHTIGHAIESYMLETGSPVSHGFAVARGLVAESWISWQTGKLSETQYLDISGLINRLYPPPVISSHAAEKMFAYMENDKKNRGTDIRFVLLEGIGKPVFDYPVDKATIIRALSATLLSA